MKTKLKPEAKKFLDLLYSYKKDMSFKEYRENMSKAWDLAQTAVVKIYERVK